MTTADYALLVSLASSVVSIVALLWNVWQKYIFVKPVLQVTFGIYRIFQEGRPGVLTPGRHLLNLTATNMGPGPLILHACILKTKADRWRRNRYKVLNPIHGDPSNPKPITIGPFSGGLPAKIDAGEMKSFYFPYDKDCCLKELLDRAGISDTYGRNNWCRHRDIKKIARQYREDFGKSVAQNELWTRKLSALWRWRAALGTREANAED
jgi:hypothetical protein